VNAKKLTFAEAFRAWQEHEGLSDHDVNKRLGLSVSTAGGWLKDGRTPYLKNVHKVANLFGVTVEQFYRGPDDGLDVRDFDTLLVMKAKHRVCEQCKARRSRTYQCKLCVLETFFAVLLDLYQGRNIDAAVGEALDEADRVLDDVNHEYDQEHEIT